MDHQMRHVQNLDTLFLLVRLHIIIFKQVFDVIVEISILDTNLLSKLFNSESAINVGFQTG